MKPKSKVSEVEDDNRSLDFNLFEKLSLLDENCKYHINKFKMGIVGNEDTVMCQLFSFEQIKSNDNDHNHDHRVDIFHGLKHEGINNGNFEYFNRSNDVGVNSIINNQDKLFHCLRISVVKIILLSNSIMLKS
jgi:hypothetical protein